MIFRSIPSLCLHHHFRHFIFSLGDRHTVRRRRRKKTLFVWPVQFLLIGDSGVFSNLKGMWWGKQGWEGWSWTRSKWDSKCQCPWCRGWDCCSVVAVHSHLNSHQLPAVTVIRVDSVWMCRHFVLTILNLTAFVCLILFVCCAWCVCVCVCVWHGLEASDTPCTMPFSCEKAKTIVPRRLLFVYSKVGCILYSVKILLWLIHN